MICIQGLKLLKLINIYLYKVPQKTDILTEFVTQEKGYFNVFSSPIILHRLLVTHGDGDPVRGVPRARLVHDDPAAVQY